MTCFGLRNCEKTAFFIRSLSGRSCRSASLTASPCPPPSLRSTGAMSLTPSPRQRSTATCSRSLGDLSAASRRVVRPSPRKLVRLRRGGSARGKVRNTRQVRIFYRTSPIHRPSKKRKIYKNVFVAVPGNGPLPFINFP